MEQKRLHGWGLTCTTVVNECLLKLKLVFLNEVTAVAVFLDEVVVRSHHSNQDGEEAFYLYFRFGKINRNIAVASRLVQRHTVGHGHISCRIACTLNRRHECQNSSLGLG